MSRLVVRPQEARFPRLETQPDRELKKVYRLGWLHTKSNTSVVEDARQSVQMFKLPQENDALCTLSVPTLSY